MVDFQRKYKSQRPQGFFMRHLGQSFDNPKSLLIIVGILLFVFWVIVSIPVGMFVSGKYIFWDIWFGK